MKDSNGERAASLCSIIGENIDGFAFVYSLVNEGDRILSHARLLLHDAVVGFVASDGIFVGETERSQQS
jgi:hypothetical protein